MKNNPIIPYILIMAFGIGLIFFLSLNGAEEKDEIAQEGEKTEQADSGKEKEASAADPEKIAQSKCISCHGNDLKGGAGPSLHGTGLSEDDVKKVLTEGTSGGMPAGLVEGEELEAMAKYVSELK